MAESPEILMRSRFSAYALGLVDYIQRTTDPQGDAWEADTAAWAASIRRFSEGTRFAGLVIDSAPAPVGDHGEVVFTAVLVQGGKDATFVERSRFRRDNVAGWLYVDGDRLNG